MTQNFQILAFLEMIMDQIKDFFFKKRREVEGEIKKFKKIFYFTLHLPPRGSLNALMWIDNSETVINCSSQGMYWVWVQG